MSDELIETLVRALFLARNSQDTNVEDALYDLLETLEVEIEYKSSGVEWKRCSGGYVCK